MYKYTVNVYPVYGTMSDQTVYIQDRLPPAHVTRTSPGNWQTTLVGKTWEFPSKVAF